jgi:hypothetical protein
MDIDDNRSQTTTNNNIGNDSNSAIENNEVAQSSLYFDLDTYISRYDPKSETRLQRLFFIASKTSNDEMARACLEMAESQLKAMGNTKVYREMHQMLNRQSLAVTDVEQLPTDATNSSTNPKNGMNTYFTLLCYPSCLHSIRLSMLYSFPFFGT